MMANDCHMEIVNNDLIEIGASLIDIGLAVPIDDDMRVPTQEQNYVSMCQCWRPDACTEQSGQFLSQRGKGYVRECQFWRQNAFKRDNCGL